MRRPTKLLYELWLTGPPRRPITHVTLTEPITDRKLNTAAGKQHVVWRHDETTGAHYARDDLTWESLVELVPAETNTGVVWVIEDHPGRCYGTRFDAVRAAKYDDYKLKAIPVDSYGKPL